MAGNLGEQLDARLQQFRAEFFFAATGALFTVGEKSSARLLCELRWNRLDRGIRMSGGRVRPFPTGECIWAEVTGVGRLVGLSDPLLGLRRRELFALPRRTSRTACSIYDGTFGTPKTKAGSRQIPLSDTGAMARGRMENPREQPRIRKR